MNLNPYLCFEGRTEEAFFAPTFGMMVDHFSVV